jgi:hypothetical protein
MHLKSILACFIAVTAPVNARAQRTIDSSQVRQWREDLAFLRKEAPARHANLFHDMSRAQFDSALNVIESRLPTLARHQVIVELQKLASLIGDGHSNVGPWRDSVIAFHSLPIALYWFSDGIVVRAADSAHASLIGGRVVDIGTLPIDSAIARVRPLISRDNEMGVRTYAPFLLAMPEVLHGIGVASSLDSVRLVIEKDGRRVATVLHSADRFPMFTGDIDKSWLPRRGWVDARDAAPVALWLSNQRETYWSWYMAAERTMYLQVNTIQQKSGDSLGTFMRRTIASTDSLGARRLVLDLRLNGGGDGSWNKQILLPLIKSRYDTAGRLFVITGRRTFSAAQMLVTELMKYTNAIFVGEPTASHGNHFGDSYRIVLPNSGVTFRVSTLWHQYLDSRDKRAMIEPVIKAPLSFADYAAGRDPALEAISRAP